MNPQDLGRLLYAHAREIPQFHDAHLAGIDIQPAA